MKKIGLLLTLTLASLCATGCDLSDLDSFFSTEQTKKEENSDNVDDKENQKNEEEETAEDQKEDKEEEKPEVVTFSVTYNGNGGIGSVLDSKEYEAGETVTIKQNGFSREGFSFVDYCIEPNGSEEHYLPGQTFIIHDDITLYAQWQQIATTVYSVTYDGNGGHGDMTDPASPYVENATVTVLSNKFLRSGYNFVNFNTKANGGGTSYNAGSKFTIESDITLYAQWEESAADPDDYYASISDSLTGDALLSALQSLNTQKRKSIVGYSSMGTTPSGKFKYTDYDPATVQYDANGQPYGTKLISFYSGNSAVSGMNREHVWPKSHGGNTVENDIHMPRPTIEKENGSRGNSFYVEGMKDGSKGWDPAMESFGDATYRGDSARIIFYCCVAETRLSLTELSYHASTNDNRDYLMGKLSDMLKWNLNYPVQDREQRRNSGAEYLQGNRNPFIDHPEYACKIWGNTNDATRAVCGGH